MNKWDQRGIDLAKHVAGWSKDPSTQTGCALIRPDHTVASLGFNGFPRGVEDNEFRLSTRKIKYAMVVHAEPNAVLSAHGPVDGCTAYVWPWPPCSSCAGILIQAGIVRVVAPRPTEEQLERWGESFNYMETMFHEAGVELVVYDGA